MGNASYVGKMQSIISMSGKNIRIPIGNMLYHTTIDADEEKVRIVIRCLSRIKRRYNLFRGALIALSITLLIALFYAMNRISGPLLFILEFATLYTIFTSAGLAFIRPRMLFPMRYNVYVHETPGRERYRSIIIVPEYWPKGRDILIIPMDSVSRIGIIRDRRKIRYTDIEIEGVEVFIADKKGKEITRFGILCVEDQVKKTAIDLWDFLQREKIEEKTQESKT